MSKPKNELTDQGTDFTTPEQRPDLNGNLYQASSTSTVFLILNGERRPISLELYGRLFIPGATVHTWPGITSVSKGADLGNATLCIDKKSGMWYLVTSQGKWYLPSLQVVATYQFNQALFKANIVPDIILGFVPNQPDVQGPTETPSDSKE